MKYIIFLAILLNFLFSNDTNIQTTLSYFETNDNNITVNNLKNKNFKPLKDNFLNRGFNQNIFWIKMSFLNKTNKELKYVVELENPTIDKISFYNHKKVVKTGDFYDFFSRDIDAINFAFNILLKPNSTNVFYIKIVTKNAVSIPINIYKKNDFFKKEIVQNRALYIFLGFMLALIIYNTYLFLVLKEKPYLYYVLFQFFYVTLLISISGIGYSFIWKNNVFLNEFTHKYFDDFALIFFIIFILSFLQIKRFFPFLYKISIVFICLILLLVVTHGFIHSVLVQPVMFGAIIFIFYTIFLSVKKKILYAKYIFIGSIFLLIGSLSTLLKNFGWIDINFFTTWAIYIFAALEGSVFSIAIAKRIEKLKEHERKLELNQKKILELEVKKQTEKLQLLLQEVNHRVKNNLQIISSYIYMSMQNTENKEVLEALNNRIQTIALLHTTLYKPDSKTDVDVNVYLTHITKEIFSIYSPKIKLICTIDNFRFDFDKTMQIGLIVNEILTNMILHAFSNISSPVIELSLKKNQNNYILIIKDNGVGFDINANNKGFGLKLIQRVITKQLFGTFKIYSSKSGSEFIITFK